MPHVIVHFDPKQVDQDVITKLKRRLQRITAKAFSSPKGNRAHPTKYYPIGNNAYLFKKAYPGHIATAPADIYVRQQAAHKTDINSAPIEIVVEAGRAKGRDPDKVAKLMEDEVRAAKLISPKLLGENKSCIWVKFCEENGFRFIQK